MSFKKNIFSNYCSSIYTILINIAIVPFYLQYMGATAFGLIGVYTVMQSWLSLLNMGLTPALSREVACCRDQKNGLSQVRPLLRSLEIIFLMINLFIISAVILNSHWLAHHWLKISNLSYTQVMYCISLMGIIAACRWFADLYRSAISSVEKQVWLNGTNIILATLRYGGSYVLLRWITRIPTHFFEYQLLIAIAEPVVLGKKFYKILSPKTNHFFNFTISWKLIFKIFPFASGLFYTTIIYIFLSQSDKLILSHILSLTTYGYFSLVVIISGGMLQCAMPVYLALLPRMTHLLSQEKKIEMLQMYRKATQLITVIMFPLIGIIAIFSAPIIYIWTGNIVAANWAGPILFWYVLGNGFFVMSAFEFYLQFACGSIKLHVIFDTLFALVYFPLILFSADHYGAMGTAITWFVMQGLLFFILPAIVHHKYAPGMHQKWLLEDIFPILITAVVMLLLLRKIPVHFELISRIDGFLIVSSMTVFLVVICAFSSNVCRDLLLTLIQRRKISI